MIIVIISFILDNIMSHMISLNSLMYPLFSILSLVIAYIYFNQKDNTYFIVAFTLGLLYDLAYTDTLFLNASIFLTLSFILRWIFNKIPYNYLSVLLLSLMTIVYYRLTIYVILFIIRYLSFEPFVLLKGIYSSIILNIIYITIIYVIINSKRLIFKRH